MQIQEQLDYGVHEDPRGTTRTTILTAATTEADAAASVSEPEHVAARAPSQFQTAAFARAEPQPEHLDTMTLTALTDMMKSEGSESFEASVVTRVYAGKLFDPESLELLENRVITVSETLGLVLDVRTFEEAEYGAETAVWKDKENRGEVSKVRTVDLRKLTVLPGFVDAHVHFFLHDYGETSWEDQVNKESLVERTVRATVHAKRTLMAGFTTVRDLGTEGAGDADIALRKCLSGPNPLIPGPRYFCADRAIASTGSYQPKSSIHVHQEGVDGVSGAEVADGVDECIKAVRRQIGAGADWIKVYYGVRSRATLAGPTPSIRTFSAPETEAMIQTAHFYGVKVAVHAANRETSISVLSQGADTLEHGMDLDNKHSFHPPRKGVHEPHLYDHRSMKELFANAIWVPTLAVFYKSGLREKNFDRWQRISETFRNALASGLQNIACGGDTGAFSHGENALEMQLMVRLGADWKKVLRWATLGGWRCVRSMAWEGEEGARRLANMARMGETATAVGDNEVPFGVLKKGWAADIVATKGDLEKDFEKAVDRGSIDFVMKAGRIYKIDGQEVPSP
ncbi:uncharacterized protein STEHIDRAFT_127652 [Stereum hirsutum FP-91666 SS1]|uniref:uncharacterized protein n=1 Tax=Stereum hirsutum (strain FP-91666) TaxID=721885 RepID=UPI000440F075|nr:uncharacterized protein STEHIDRAFT_127652 [Stereum hirsutum FP-91666 SS1]EIM92912.1 hypothetical protein STEHIDRAFT_127652 [Stereum hirsutum FP-91666 SS1]